MPSTQSNSVRFSTRMTLGKTFLVSLLCFVSLMEPAMALPNPKAAAATTATAAGSTLAREEEDDDVLDVAVVGAGPAGLATARALRRALGPDAKIRVFERSVSLDRDAGSHVGLLPLARKALDALDPSREASRLIEARGDCRRLLKRYDAGGLLLDEIPCDPTDPDTKIVVIPWHRLQSALAVAVPEDDLCLGHCLESVAEDEDSGVVRLSFTNGAACAARLLIGADGINSRVRRSLGLGDGAEGEELHPVYNGSVIWRMRLSPEAAERCGLETGVSYVYGQDGKILAVQTFGTGANARVYVSGQAAWPEDRLDVLAKRYQNPSGYREREEVGGSTEAAGSTPDSHQATEPESPLARFLHEFRDYPQDLMETIRTTCRPESLLEHPVHFWPPGTPWGTGRATLVGDAAHGLPPNSAMGAPLAFEDAAALGSALAEHGCTPRALRSYEDARVPRVGTIASQILEQSTSYYQDRDDEANPFRLDEKAQSLYEFVTNFSQDPVPAYGEELPQGA